MANCNLTKYRPKGIKQEEEMEETWNIPRDLEADGISAVNRFFKEFQKEHGFSRTEVRHKLIHKGVFEKIFIIHERFKPLIEKHANKVNHYAHKPHHTVSFEKIPASKNWRLYVRAETLELYFLMRILNSILREFETKKAARIIHNKNLIINSVGKAIKQTTVSAKIIYRVWYKKKVYFACIKIGKGVTMFQDENVNILKETIEEVLPILLQVIKKKRRRYR